MISVKVTYTVQPEFVSQNLNNIRDFLADFQAIDADFKYSVYLLNDGVTFMHVSSYGSMEIQERVLALESFKRFQSRRDASGLNGSHNLEAVTFVGSADV